jgi:2-C-methyl-D-erythritol 4-phosphate cytidylyltransferase
MKTLVLLAGGSGARMGDAVPDKTLAQLAGQPVITHSACTFDKSGLFENCIVVYRDAGQLQQLKTVLAPLEMKTEFVQGGPTRQASVNNALQAVSDSTSHVFIHDVARPLISPAAIKQVDSALEKNEAVVLARPVSDTIKRIPANGEIEEITLEDLERQRLWAMETPQAFEFAALKNAYIKANDEALNFTDDAAVASHSGIKITLIPNPKPNPKLTEVEDFAWIEHLLAQD